MKEALRNVRYQSAMILEKMRLFLPNHGNKNQAIIQVENDQVLNEANLIPESFNFDYHTHQFAKKIATI